MKRIFLYSAILLLCACNTYERVEISILVPPEYMSEDIYSANLYSNVPQLGSNCQHSIHEVNIGTATHRITNKTSEIVQVDSLSVFALQSCQAYLDMPQLLDSTSILNDASLPSLNLSNVDIFFQEYPSDVFLVLENIFYKKVLNKYHYNYYVTGDQELSISTHSKWSLHYADKSKKSISFNIQDTLYWANPSDNFFPYLEEALWNNGKLAADKVSPSWKDVVRLYNGGGNTAIKQAASYVQAHEWEKAAKIWIDIYNGHKKDTKQKARMAYNMALFFETQNDITTSLEWLNIAKHIYSTKEAEAELSLCVMYEKILKNRIDYEERLNLMFK